MFLTDLLRKHERLIVAETLLGLSKAADVGSTMLCTGVHGAIVESSNIGRYLITQVGPEGFASLEVAFVSACAYALRNSSKEMIYSLTAIQASIALQNLYAYYFL